MDNSKILKQTEKENAIETYNNQILRDQHHKMNKKSVICSVIICIGTNFLLG